MKPINVRNIQLALFKDLRSSCRLVAPNYTPQGWFECDIFAVSNSGYGAEYEIKLSASDFRADAKKVRKRWEEMRDGDHGKAPTEGKHYLLGTRSSNGPSRFFYVMPKHLVTVEEIPDWAGIIWATRSNWDKNMAHLSHFRQAPRLHKEKVSEKILVHLRGIFYWRFWTALHHNYTRTNKPDAAQAAELL